MMYDVGETFNDVYEGLVKCVEDKKYDSGCLCCVFSDEGEACDAREYNHHPCYHTDRDDFCDVHFIKVEEE